MPYASSETQGDGSGSLSSQGLYYDPVRDVTVL